MKTLFQTGQKIYINYKGTILRYIYGGYKNTSGFHRLDSFRQTLFITDETLSKLLIDNYNPSSLQEKFNDLLDFLSFDIKKGVASF